MSLATSIIVAIIILCALCIVWFTTDSSTSGPSAEPVEATSSHTSSSSSEKDSIFASTTPSSSSSSSSSSSIAMARSDVPSCALDFYAKAESEFVQQHDDGGAKRKFSPHVSSTFMIHYSPLKKRRREMTQMLAQHGVFVDRWILEFDRDNLTSSMKECFHPSAWMPASSFTPSSSSSSSSVARKMKRHQLGKPITQRLRPTQISVVTKHYFAIYLASKQPGLSLIIEDDVLLRNGFANHVAKILDEAKQKAIKSGGSTTTTWNFDVLMIGGCLKMHAHRKKYAAPRWTEHLYLKQEARCAHAYIVTPRGAQKLMRSLPLTLPIDFQLSSAFKEEEATVLWVEPWLAVQGDIDGGCVTSTLSEGYKKCPTMFLKPYPAWFNLSFLEKTRDF